MSTLIQADTAAEAAAQWWAEQVGAPRFDNGDDSEAGAMAMMLGTIAASGHPVSEDQGRKFTEALAPRIERLLDRIDWVALGVDYGPDRELAEAAEEAGISLNRFPWKTNSYIQRSHVTVSLGYRGRTTLIWHAADWVHPACGDNRYDEATNEFFDEVCTLPRYHAEGHGGWKPDPLRCAECGGTFSDHYGNASRKNQTDRGDYHSWTPEGR